MTCLFYKINLRCGRLLYHYIGMSDLSRKNRQNPARLRSLTQSLFSLKVGGMNKQETAEAILGTLSVVYTDLKPMLKFHSPFELLIGVILSAQTTDEQVNRILPALFSRYPDAEALASADLQELETIVFSTGFYRVKARNVKGTCLILQERFNGAVPRTMEELLELPGVGRKSANVLLGHCFGQPAVIVDTHFMRVCRRIGLTEEKEPFRIEMEVKGIVPEQDQYRFSMLINRHGRVCCKAKGFDCTVCAIASLCGFQGKKGAFGQQALV